MGRGSVTVSSQTSLASNDMGLTREWLIQGNTQTRRSGDSKNSCHRRLAVTALWHCVSKSPQTGWDLADPRRCCRNGLWQCDCVFPHKLGISNDMGLTREWLIQGNTQTRRCGDSKNSCHRRLAVTDMRGGCTFNLHSILSFFAIFFPLSVVGIPWDMQICPEMYETPLGPTSSH